MGDDDKTVGMILGQLAAIQSDVKDIKDGKAAMCQLHTSKLERMEAKLDSAAVTAAETEASIGPLTLKGFSGRDVGRIVAYILLAYIFLKVLGVPVPTLDTFRSQPVASTVVHESAIP